nr:YnbE family lipoprotein [Pseudoalteromonas sp. T1lg48]
MLVALVGALTLMGCTHRVEVESKEPITINLNVKVDHEIRVKVDKELDELFGDDSELF